MALSDKEKGIKEKKLAKVDDYINARLQVKAALTANYNADMARLDAEIDAAQLEKKAMNDLK